jgi:hypothetical protein
MRTFLLLALVLLSGCAIQPHVRVQAKPDADFSAYRSFAFFSPLGTDNAGYDSFLSQHLRDATQKTLTARGYRYDEENPDLLVDFKVEMKDRTDVVSFPSIGYYGGYRHWFGMWHFPDVTTIHYQERTLKINLIDARQKQLLWEGVTTTRLAGKSRRNPEAVTYSTVERIFSRYPYRLSADGRLEEGEPEKEEGS